MYIMTTSVSTMKPVRIGLVASMAMNAELTVMMDDSTCGMLMEIICRSVSASLV